MARIAKLAAVVVGIGCSLACSRLHRAKKGEPAATAAAPSIAAAPAVSAPEAAPATPAPLASATSPDGYTQVRVAGVTHMPGGGDAVLLVEDAKRRALPIFIGGTEALSIELRLKKRSFPRPLTHDLYDRTVHELGGRVESVRVDKLENNTFYGTVIVLEGRHRFELDARPSDAIALALGNGAPIQVSRTLLEHAGLDLDKIPETHEEDQLDDERRPPPVSL
jgi:uncharacterized protein